LPALPRAVVPTDPLAAGLLHIIILELEADLQKDWEIGRRKCQDR
jgi:hypothetical protein